MAESRIKDENYYQITGWMINKLNLKGAALSVFAIIYGFSQDGESEFSGSRQYLADFINSSKPTIDKALTELCNSDYLIKTSKVINNIMFNTYKVNLEVVKKLCEGSKETLPPSKETLQEGSKETLPNNNINNNNINNNINNKKERKKEDYNSIINDNFSNDRVKDTLLEFIKMRKLMKKPLTDFALKKLCNHLKKLSSNDNEQVAILEQSIIHNWQGIFPLKKDNQYQQIPAEETPVKKNWYDI